jgi:hypothetical protein
VAFWLARDAANVEKRVAQEWPGWTVRWHRDRYEEQLAVTNGLISLPVRPRGSLLECLQRILLANDMRSGAELVQEFAERDRKEGKQVEVNPWALRDDRLAISESQRREVFSAAIVALGWEGLDRVG